MKILVCISKAPDTTSKIVFKNENKEFQADGVQWILNPYDEWYALVRAIELKEKDASIQIDLLMVGLADDDPIIRKALALGGDKAYRVNVAPHDPFLVASAIKALATKELYDLILTGKETIDYNSSAVGGMTAALLDIGYITLGTKLDIQSNKAIVVREIEGGEETIEASLPLVISCQKGMAEQRIPNMKGIMSARNKVLQVLSLEDVGIANIENLVSVDHFDLPPAKKGCRMISADNPEQLVSLLHEEAKLI